MFNKFHGMFCTNRHFIHKYHMAGWVSEESNEAFNDALEKSERLLACMPATVGQLELVNRRTQGTKLTIRSVTEGHKRGPYKSRPASADSGKLVSSVVRSVEFKQKHYFELTDGNLILETWKDIYE